MQVFISLRTNSIYQTGHCATAEATGVWIDMMLRKTTTPPDDILVVMNDFKTENTKLLSEKTLKHCLSVRKI